MLGKLKKFVVSCDLANDKSDHGKLFTVIMEQQEARQIQKSLYLFRSSKTAQQLLDLLKAHVEEGDGIFIAQYTDRAGINLLAPPL